MAPSTLIDFEKNGTSKIIPDARVHGPQKSKSGGDYLEMGRELLRAMEDLHGELRAEGFGTPSTSVMDQKAEGKVGEAARERITELSQRILATTMDPGMNLLISSLQFHFCSCLKVAVDLEIAEKIPKHGHVSAEELSRSTGADKALLIRIMRVLTTKYVFAEDHPQIYSHTAMSWVMCGNDQKHLLKHRLDEGFRSSSRQADALRVGGYREPVLGDKYGFNLAFQSEQNFWHYITTVEPKRGDNFNSAMRAVNINSLNMIPQLYPFNNLSENGGLIVDIGGGLGQDEFANSGSPGHGDVNGVDIVANGNGVSHEVKPQVTLEQHNFFDPQPVKGAAAYFLRHILHDWPDGACITILRQIIPAMDQEHSKILICDQVMEETNPSIPSILYDIDMMSMFGGKERKLSEWEELIRSADERLHITDVRKSASHTAILEVRLKTIME